MPAEAVNNSNKSVLIAEDDPFISRMYQIKLTNGGYNVTVKNNGREAFESIKASKPSLIMLDLNMPELSGLEVLAALKNDNFDFAKTPVVVLTNSSKDDDRKTAQGYGAEYLVKAELTPKQVLEIINNKLKTTESS